VDRRRYDRGFLGSSRAIALRSEGFEREARRYVRPESGAGENRELETLPPCAPRLP
jgi:hypothetical protein